MDTIDLTVKYSVIFLDKEFSVDWENATYTTWETPGHEGSNQGNHIDYIWQSNSGDGNEYAARHNISLAPEVLFSDGYMLMHRASTGDTGTSGFPGGTWWVATIDQFTISRIEGTIEIITE